MNDAKRIKNIVAFLSILFGESDLWGKEIMQFTPEYLMEKFELYIESNKYSADWGLHPSLRRNIFNRYCKKHKIKYELE